jgi:hypothetical protein
MKQIERNLKSSTIKFQDYKNILMFLIIAELDLLNFSKINLRFFIDCAKFNLLIMINTEEARFKNKYSISSEEPLLNNLFNIAQTSAALVEQHCRDAEKLKYIKIISRAAKKALTSIAKTSKKSIKQLEHSASSITLSLPAKNEISAVHYLERVLEITETITAKNSTDTSNRRLTLLHESVMRLRTILSRISTQIKTDIICEMPVNDLPDFISSKPELLKVTAYYLRLLTAATANLINKHHSDTGNAANTGLRKIILSTASYYYRVTDKKPAAFPYESKKQNAIYGGTFYRFLIDFNNFIHIGKPNAIGFLATEISDLFKEKFPQSDEQSTT